MKKVRRYPVAVIVRAFRRSLRQPLPSVATLLFSEDAELCQLIGLCKAMDTLHRGGSWPLAVTTVGRLISHKHARRRVTENLSVVIGYGVIARVQRAGVTRYRWIEDDERCGQARHAVGRRGGRSVPGSRRKPVPADASFKEVAH
jgi:hypothetical protein